MSLPLEMPTALTTAEVMRALRLKDPETVYSLRRRKKIRGVKVGREWRFDADSVVSFLRGDPPAQPKAKPARAALPSWAEGIEEIIK